MPPETEEKKEEKGNLPDPVQQALEEIKQKLENPPAKEEPVIPSGPTAADKRAEIQKRLGFNDDQMAAHEEMIMRSQAPIIENTGWTRLEKKADIETFRKEIEAELAIYPQERRTPDVMEKIYFFVKGKHADSKPTKTNEPDKRVVDTRVSRGPGYTGSEPGLTGSPRSTEGAPEEEALSDSEKFVAAKLGVDEKDYAKSKAAGRAIRELRVPDDRPATSMADIELRRLTGRR